MKRLIFTVASRNFEKEEEIGYDSITVPRMAKYAKTVNADFFVYRGDGVLDWDRWKGVPAWYRIAFLERVRRQDYYDQILYLDADVIIHPKAGNIFNVHGDFDFSWVEEGWCNGRVFPEHRKFVVKNFGVDPRYKTYCNAGVLVCSRSGLDKMDFSGPFPNEPLYDQCWLNYKLNTIPGMKVQHLPLRWNMIPTKDNIDKVGFHHCAFEHKSLLETLDSKYNSVN